MAPHDESRVGPFVEQTMKKTAILIDGEWFRRGLQQALKPQLPNGVTADVMYRNALLAIDASVEEIYRIFYYDCPPYEGTETNPIDKSVVKFKNQPKHAARSLFLDQIARKDFVALRLGVAKRRGWHLTDQWVKQAISGQVSGTPQASDVYLSLEQKGVDMRLGIDVASLALKEQVERIVVISGDTDMIPALKLARREGVQVILVAIQQWVKLNKALTEDADIVREIVPVP